MTISQVGERYGLTPDTLRYYEKVGLIPPVPRNSSGIRDYDEASCGWVEFIKCFRKAGVPIDTLIEYVSLYQQGEATKKARRQLLVNELELLDQRIEELQQTRSRLVNKIQHYDGVENWEKCEKQLLA